MKNLIFKGLIILFAQNTFGTESKLLNAERFVHLAKTAIDRNYECSICLDDISEEMITLPCTHFFCKECIIQLFNNNIYACPLCRVEHKIFALIKLLGDASSTVREEASRNLGRLSFKIVCNKEAMIREQAIPPLVDLLKDTSVAARNAACTLCNLAFDSESKALIVESEAIGPLIGLLRSYKTCIETAEYAARTLTNLASDGRYQRLIAEEEDIIPFLIILLSKKKPILRSLSAVLLWNLAFDNIDNKETIVTAGAIPILVNLLKDRSYEIRERAAGVLSNLIYENSKNKLLISKSARKHRKKIEIYLREMEEEMERKWVKGLRDLNKELDVLK